MKRYALIPVWKLDVAGLKGIVPVNDGFDAHVDYRNYRLLKHSPCYGDKVARDLHKIAKKIAAQMNEHTSPVKNQMSVISFLENYSQHLMQAKIPKAWLSGHLNSIQKTQPRQL